MPRISVIIVNYNGGDRLARCLAALAAQTFTDFETIVVDNASSDGSQAHAEAAGDAVTLIALDENTGFAAANNRAAEVARGDWLACLNPDAYAEPDWLDELMGAVERYPWADAFGSAQIDALDPTRLDGAGDAYFFAGVPYRGHHGWPVERAPAADGECFAPCAAAALYRRATFTALGGFEERFFCYGEDVDLGFRLRLAGGRCVQVRAARVAHEGSAISGRRSAFTIYHGHRNRIWTYLRDMPLPTLIAGLPLHVAINLYLLVRFAFLGSAIPYLQALRDGYAAWPELAQERGPLHRGRASPRRALHRVLTWSPLRLARRAADLRRIEEVGAVEVPRDDERPAASPP